MTQLTLGLEKIRITTPSSSSAPSSPTLSYSSLSPLLLKVYVMGDHQNGNKYPSEYVKLNIGGSLHYTTITTLRKHDTMLRAMFSGRMEVLTDSEGKTKFPGFPEIQHLVQFYM